MTGYITLDRMHFYAHHGVLPQERRVGNDFEVTLRLCYPIADATVSDNLADTLNYARIIRSLQARFPLITSGTVTVAKLTPPFKCEIASVAVTIDF